MKGFTNMITRNMTITKTRDKAVMFKGKNKIREDNHDVIYVETLWVPLSIVQYENEQIFVPQWFLKKNPPKSFRIQIPNATDNCAHIYGEPVTGYSDSYTQTCTKCGHVKWDE